MAEKLIEIKVKHQVTKEEVVTSVDLKENLQEAVNAFGEDVVMSNFIVGAKTAARNSLYSKTHGADETKIMSAEDAVAELASWQPGLAAARTARDPLAESKKKFATMSPEEQANYLAELRAVVEGVEG